MATDRDRDVVREVYCCLAILNRKIDAARMLDIEVDLRRNEISGQYVAVCQRTETIFPEEPVRQPAVTLATKGIFKK